MQPRTSHCDYDTVGMPRFSIYCTKTGADRADVCMNSTYFELLSSVTTLLVPAKPRHGCYDPIPSGPACSSHDCRCRCLPPPPLWLWGGRRPPSVLSPPTVNPRLAAAGGGGGGGRCFQGPFWRQQTSLKRWSTSSQGVRCLPDYCQAIRLPPGLALMLLSPIPMACLRW